MQTWKQIGVDTISKKDITSKMFRSVYEELLVSIA